MVLQSALLLSTAVVAITAGATASASAQTTTPEAVHVLDDIVVTAERRATTVQKTPIAIAAFSAEQIEARGLNTVAALTNAAPGVRFYDAIGQGFVSIRGVGAERNTTGGGDPSVAFNVDGVYIARNNGPAAVFYDLARIEVLRGPQGTLYGRNATGGVINVINNTPDLDGLSGDLDASVGSFDRLRLRGAVNAPLVADRAALRLSGLYEKRDGYTRNVRPGGGDDVNDQYDRAARLQLLIEPSEELRSVTSVSYTKRAGNGPQDKFLGAFNPLLRNVYGSPPNPADPHETVTDLDQNVGDKAVSASNSIDWRTRNELLGDLVVSAVLGYVNQDAKIFIDPDSSGAAFANNILVSDNEQKSVELRIASRGDGSLDWVVGVYHLSEDNLSTTQFNALSPTGALVRSQFASLKIKAKSSAIFGQAVYQASDRLRVTLGARYSQDDKDGTQRIAVQPVNLNIQDVSSRSWDAVTGKLGVDYDLAPGKLLYAVVSRGYKSGGYGLNQAPYNPEYVWAYELGSKNRLMQGKLTLNGSVFYYDQSDKQIAYTGQGIVGQPTLIIQNVAAGKVFGAELEWQARPIGNLLIEGSLSYLDSTYKRYASADPAQPAAGVINLAGARQSFAPEWSYNIGVQYRFDLGAAGSITPRADLNFVDQMKLRPFGVAADIESSSQHVDLRVAWRNRAESLVLEGFVENATNDVARLSVLYNGLTGGFQSPYSAPRTYGVRLGLNF